MLMLKSSNTAKRRTVHGVTLVELLVAIVIGLLVTSALLAVLLTVSRSNTEMAKQNQQLESGRFTFQLLEQDLQHAGFWGGYVPDFDNLMFDDGTPVAPSAIPDPCLTYGPDWTDEYRANLIGVPVSIHSSPPGTCSALLGNHKSGTDIVVVRYAETCIAGDAGCEAPLAGKVYFQPSLCGGKAGVGAGPDTVRLASSVKGPLPKGIVVRIIDGSGKGHMRPIDTYDPESQLAVVEPPWNSDWRNQEGAVIDAQGDAPNDSSVYTFGEKDYVIGTNGFDLRNGTCNASSPLRAFVSHIYYIRDYSAVVGDDIPTLVRARLHVGGTPAAPAYLIEPLVEGVEDMRVELGVDNIGKTGATVELDDEIKWVDDKVRKDPTNRGDGVSDSTCTTQSPCTLDDLSNTVLAKIFVLARTVEPTPSTKDKKSYCLATQDSAGKCPSGYELAFTGSAANYTRHVYSTAIRFHNISGRRETP